ncbi:hypothetical protein CJD35_06480 [Sphingobium xenophagum]|uniref:Glc operon protein GlcG n=1 Tax=Sphingobium xenophagum TaxID=121428 RepID=A0A249MWL5_SPHXE|nr:hypothetical protein CJD35_06480 [Sphingobium xenophagum]
MNPVTYIQALPAASASQAMLAAAVRRAEQLGVRVNIAVVDGGGNLAGFIRMPGSFLSSIEMAIDKAYTAASFGMSTRGFGDLLETASRPVRDGMLRRPRLSEVPGGAPIMVDDQMLGAIGVSGASDEQDEDIATAALTALEGLTA